MAAQYTGVCMWGGCVGACVCVYMWGVRGCVCMGGGAWVCVGDAWMCVLHCSSH